MIFWVAAIFLLPVSPIWPPRRPFLPYGRTNLALAGILVPFSVDRHTDGQIKSQMQLIILSIPEILPHIVNITVLLLLEKLNNTHKMGNKYVNDFLVQVYLGCPR